MKILDKIKVLILCLIMFIGVTSCDDETIVDFGFDGAISGTVKDQNDNVVAGSITNTNLVVKALGEGDQVSTDMRVKGDGTYQHTKLYPKEYKIWIAGPVSMTTDTLLIDFSKEKVVQNDLIVVPFISISQPVVAGSPTASTVDISYDLTPNDGKVVSKRELYCSTNPFPDASTGSGPFYHSKNVSLGTNAGNASVTGLTSNTKYYIRIGAQATGASGFNYSEQIVITTQ
ncbi:MAG: hypothetical protein WD824_12165 [Cyclobacteriaceae bacterium]